MPAAMTARPFRLVPVRQEFARRASVSQESDAPFRRWVHVVPFGSQALGDRDDAFEFDKAAAESVIRWWEHYREHGRRTIFDWGHGSMAADAPPESAGKAGEVVAWEIRDSGLWALGEFTERAAALIRSGDYDQVSPEIWSSVKNLDSDEWTEGPAIMAVALTARPALAGLEVLAASVRWRAFGARFGRKDAGEIMTMIEAAVDRLARAGVFGSLGGRVSDDRSDQWAVRVMTVDPDWLTVTVHNLQVHRFFSVALSEEDGQMVVGRVREMVLMPQPGETPGDEGETTMIDTRQDDEARKAAILSAVGDATPEAVTAALALAQAAMVAGADTPDKVAALAVRPNSDVIATLRTELSARDARLGSLEAEAKALRDERAERDAADLVARHEALGRIVPATRPHMLSLARKDPEAARALFEALPRVANLAPGGTSAEMQDAAPAAGLHEAIQARALAICEREGLAPEDAWKVYGKAASEIDATAEGIVLKRHHYAAIPAARH